VDGEESPQKAKALSATNTEGLLDRQNSKALEVSQRRDFDGITDLFYGTGGLLIGFWFLHSNNCQRKPMPAKLNQPQQDSLLRVVPHITARMGISRSGWWKGVKDGKFPPGIKLSPRVTVWKSSEIDSLIASLGR